MKLNRKQWSLLISFFIMMLVLLTLFNIHLSAKEDKEILYELRFEDPKKPEKTSSPEEDKLETHMAYNESVKSRFDKEVREFKTLEELKEGKKSDEAEENEENEEAETSDEIPSEPQQDYMSSETGESVASRATRNKKQQAEKSEGDNTSDTKVENNSVNHHSSISYSLVNRVHRSLPNPVYTCSARGKIVINIKVDALGNVTDASFNKRSSTSGNGCLVEHAITYALRAKFEKKEGNDSQVGTITYLFQG